MIHDQPEKESAGSWKRRAGRECWQQHSTDMYSTEPRRSWLCYSCLLDLPEYITITWVFIDPGGEILFSLSNLHRKERARGQTQYREAQWSSQKFTSRFMKIMMQITICAGRYLCWSIRAAEWELCNKYHAAASGLRQNKHSFATFMMLLCSNSSPLDPMIYLVWKIVLDSKTHWLFVLLYYDTHTMF